MLCSTDICEVVAHNAVQSDLAPLSEQPDREYPYSQYRTVNSFLFFVGRKLLFMMNPVQKMNNSGSMREKLLSCFDF
jgi:hypothetical protein